MIGAVRSALDSNPSYLSHFGLREMPFSSNESRFFYADPARQQCLGMLQHLAEFSEEWLLVAGPAGVGKSSLLAEFIARAESHICPCHIEGKQPIEGGQLFFNIARRFGLDLSRKTESTPLDALRQHLNALHADQVSVVAIDDADRLSDDALEIVVHLADLQGTHGKLVRVVLFADHSLQKRLADPRFSILSKPHMMELRPFDEAETGRYLAHRMSVAGFSGPNPFDAKAVRQIHKESSGLPSRINSSADRFLKELAAEKKKSTAGAKNRLLVPATAVAVLGLAAYLLQGQLGGNDTEAPAAKTPLSAANPPSAQSISQNTVATIPAPPFKPSPAVTQENSVAKAPVETVQNIAFDERPAPTEVKLPATEEPKSPQPEPTPIKENGPAQATGKEETAKRFVEKPVAPKKAMAATKPLSGEEWFRAQPVNRFTLQLLVANQQSTVREFLRNHPLRGSHAIVEANHNGTPVHVLVFGSFADKQEAEAAARRFPVEVQPWPRTFGEIRYNYQPVVAAAVIPSKGLKKREWIAARDPRHFTVQLVGAEHEEAIRDFAGKTPLPEPTALVTIERDGKPWFVLLYGDFADHDTALKAHDALPAHLRQGAPFVREFSAIQAALTPTTSR